MNFDRSRMRKLLRAVEDDNVRKTLLTGRFHMSIGLIREFSDEHEERVTTGCIAGIAWLLAGGRVPDDADHYCISYWDHVCPTAVAWLQGFDPFDDPDELPPGWKDIWEPPLFDAAWAGAFRWDRMNRTENKDGIGPQEAGEAIRLVIQSGDLYFNPWEAMSRALG